MKTPVIFLLIYVFFILGVLAISRTVNAASSFYTIQISSPLQERQAHSLVAKLRTQGVDSFETKIFVRGKKHYRVCSGYFENPKKAAEARGAISKLTHRRDVFVQRLKGSALPNRMVLGDFD